MTRQLRVLLLASAAALTACVTTPPPLQGASQLPPGSTGEPLPPPPPLPPVATSDALPPDRARETQAIESGMVLTIRVTDEPALTQDEAAVGVDGRVFVPFLGRIRATGATPTALARTISDELRRREYLRAPEVEVEVVSRGDHRAFILGRVGRPGAYELPVEHPLTLSQLIAMAGGLATAKSDLEADPTALRLLRTVAGKRRTYRISFLDIVDAGDLRRDVTIHAGDVVYVPPKRQLYIYGAVREPGGFPLTSGSRLTADQALQLAGGLEDDADTDNLLLIRATDGSDLQTYGLPGDPVARAKIELTTDDTVVVPTRRGNRVFVLGQVDKAGAIPIDQPGLTVIRVLSLAGGQTRIASGTVQLIRWIDGKAKSFDVPVGQILSSGELDRDPLVQPGDLIVVPEGIF